MTWIIVGLLTLILDLLIGEIRSGHPVKWIGRLLGFGEALRSGTPGRDFLAGALVVIVVAAAFSAVAALAQYHLLASGSWYALPVLAVLAKPGLSVRELWRVTRQADQLIATDLKAARGYVSRHLVSRDTSALGAAELRQATVSSAVENIVDSVVAPLLFLLILGLPGIWAYRVINTADAMYGYRNKKWEYFGKFAARTDDLLNFVPARVTAALLYVAALPGGLVSLGTLYREATKTPSINGGWPMACFALTHGIRLEKKGAYILNPGGTPPTSNSVQTAALYVILSGPLVLVLCYLGSLLIA